MDLPEYLAYAKAHLYASGGRATLRAQGVFAFLVLVAGGLGIHLGLAGGQFWLVFAIGAYYFLQTLFYSHRLRRYYLQLKQTPEEVEVSIGDESISVSKKTMKSRTDWDFVSMLCDSPQGLLVYTEDKVPLAWIPHWAFPGGESKADVLAAAARHNVKILHMRAG
jgi:hypothetical protein